MKLRLILILVCAALVLGACNTPPAATSQVESTANYPAPTDMVYPAPGATQEKLSQLYPEPKSGDEVAWDHVVAMMYNGEVTQIVQSSSLQLTLSLRDGRTLVAKETTYDDVKIVIQKCGDPCKGIKLVNQ